MRPCHVFLPLLALLVGVVAPLPAGDSPAAAASLCQFGITWTFDRAYPVGRYANGDHWVVGPVRIVAITPATALLGKRQINGTMLNPAAGMGVSQGWDSDVQNTTYNAQLNVALNLPLEVAGGTSVMSAASIEKPEQGGHAPRIDTIAVLTVVAQAPAPGSFRPPYAGTDKSGDWNENRLDYGILRELDPVADTPDIAACAEHFLRPWIEVQTSTGGRYLHPRSSQPGYGRDLSNQLQEGLLLLHLKFSKEQKRNLYVRLVQFGLDVYGAAKAGGYWAPLGGFNQGRKMPMLLAGLALQDPRILAYADAQSKDPNGFIFQEDLQTWYITRADVGRPLHHGDNRQRDAYIEADIGLAEWGEQHAKSPQRDGRNWNAYYRDTCYRSELGHALAAQLTPGAVKAWNWPAFFDYMDRAFPLADKETPLFVRNMWTAYRRLGTPVSNGRQAVVPEGR